MEKTNLKIGRNTFEIDEKDVVLFNGACWMLLTKKVKKGWHDYSPTMSKALCGKLVKKGILILVKKEREYTTLDGKQMGLYYYKFDIAKLNEHLKEGE